MDISYHGDIQFDLSEKDIQEAVGLTLAGHYLICDPCGLQVDREMCKIIGIDLQGSCADGFFINGPEKSDIDFMYSINKLLQTSKNYCLEIKHILSNPQAPAFIMVEVESNLSETDDKCQNEKINYLIEQRGGHFYLSIRNLKELIIERVNESSLNIPKNVRFSIDSDEAICFRIKLQFTKSSVLTSIFKHIIPCLKQFIDCIQILEDIDQPRKELFQKLNEVLKICYVSESEWLKFKTTLVNTNMKSFTEKYFENFCNIFLEFHFTKYTDTLFSNYSKIFEQFLYTFLSCLVSCNFSSIVGIVKNKQIHFIEKQRYWNRIGILNFTKHEISQISLVDISSTTSSLKTYVCKSDEAILNKLIIALDDIISEIQKELRTQIDNVFQRRNKLDYFKDTFNELIKQLTVETYSGDAIWCQLILTMVMKLLTASINIVENNGKYENCLEPSDILSVEIIPSLQCNAWPSAATDWCMRKRHWPNQEIVNKIIDNGCHVVFKSYIKYDSNYNGRLSFSTAELILCESLSPAQKRVLFWVKEFTYDHLSKPRRILKSYYIKTLCFWEFENLSQDNIVIFERECRYHIIKNLCRSVKSRTLSHYFIPEHNLFLNFTDDDYKIIQQQLKLILLEEKNLLGLGDPSRSFYQITDLDVDLFFRFGEKIFYEVISHCLNKL